MPQALKPVPTKFRKPCGHERNDERRWRSPQLPSQSNYHVGDLRRSSLGSPGLTQDARKSPLGQSKDHELEKNDRICLRECFLAYVEHFQEPWANCTPPELLSGSEVYGIVFRAFACPLKDHGEGGGSLRDTNLKAGHRPSSSSDPDTYYMCKGFRRIVDVRQHVRRQHLQRPHCSTCGKTFDNDADHPQLNEHIRRSNCHHLSEGLIR